VYIAVWLVIAGIVVVWTIGYISGQV